MKWGKRQFSLMDMIGDVVMHMWANRQHTTLEDLTRRTMKLAVLVLVILTMVHVLYPTQRRGWALWLGTGEEDLANWTAIVLVGFSALILTLVRTSWTHNHKGLAIGAGAFMACLMLVVLGGTWNYYSATSNKAVGASAAAIGGSQDRVKEAQAALASLDAREKANADAVTAAMKGASANVVTGRARLLAQQNAASKGFADERIRLNAELKEARTASVGAQTDNFDPRPIDGVMAAWFHVERTFMASINDLIRSANFEFIAILGVALGTTVALSRVGMHEALGPRMAIEDMRNDSRHEEAPAPGEDVVQKREVVFDEDGEPMIYRKGGHVRRPKVSRSSRKGDKTEYERAATMSAGDPRSTSYTASDDLPPEPEVEPEIAPEAIRPEPFVEAEEPPPPVEMVVEEVSDEEFQAMRDAGRVTADGYEIPDPVQAIEQDDQSVFLKGLPKPNGVDSSKETMQ